jgi:predicted amidohydrolase YtcJ
MLALFSFASVQTSFAEIEPNQSGGPLTIERPSLSDHSSCEVSDLLLHNARIHTPIKRAPDTSDYEMASYEALAIKDGVFVFVGSEVNADEWKYDASEVMDLQGSTVFPGFTDSHQHLEGVGRRTKTLSLFGITSLKATVSRIRDWSEQILEGG